MRPRSRCGKLIPGKGGKVCLQSRAIFLRKRDLKFLFEPVLLECYLPTGVACAQVCAPPGFFACGIDEYMLLRCEYHAQKLAFWLGCVTGDASAQWYMFRLARLLTC